MAGPTSPIAGTKRRPESLSPEPIDAAVQAASSSLTFTGATSVTPRPTPFSQGNHKRARLEEETTMIASTSGFTTQSGEKDAPSAEVDEAALSATASTRASTIEPIAPPANGETEAVEAPEATTPVPFWGQLAASELLKKPETRSTLQTDSSTISSSSSGDPPVNSTLDCSVFKEDTSRATASRKRPRLEYAAEESEFTVALPVPEQQRITRPRSLRDIPVELLAEILLYTQSLRDVLSVAMSCKFYCQTLLQPSSNYIWKNVREHHTPRPPPDYKTLNLGFDEVSYAAFLFAGGKCEGCGEHTDRPFVSYALRLRLCGIQSCEDRIVKSQALKSVNKVCRENNLREYEDLFAVLEDKHILKSYKSIQEPFSFGSGSEEGRAVTRSKVPGTLRSFLVEERDRPGFREKLKDLKSKQKNWMKLCGDLIRWRRAVKDAFYIQKKANENIGKTLADGLGWKYQDMVNCTDFGPYQRNKNHTFQTIMKEEVLAMSSKIEDQLTALEEKRDRRTHEVVYQEVRQQILKHYQQLQSSQTFPILPALTAFRQLPVITMLQTSEGEEKTEAKDVAKSLKSDKVLISLLKSQINNWVGKARSEFGEKMGVRGWKSISKNELHPAERITARFSCTRCKFLGPKYEMDGCFDFAGACGHDCSKPGKKKNNGKWKWGAELFVKDVKASAAVAKYLELCKLPDKAVSTSETVAVLQDANYILCKSCDTPIVMKFNNLIGHSHRHEKMDFELLQDPETVEAAIGKKYTFRQGLTKALLTSSAKAKEARDVKVFGCWHCYNKQLADHRQTSAAKKAAQGSSAPDADAPVVEEPEPDARLFIFDGLKSHLIEKHEIMDVRDEDYFCTQIPGYLQRKS